MENVFFMKSIIAFIFALLMGPACGANPSTGQSSRADQSHFRIEVVGVDAQDQKDFITGGDKFIFDEFSGRVKVRFNGSHLEINYTSLDQREWWSFHFEPGKGAKMKRERYLDARRWPFTSNRDVEDTSAVQDLNKAKVKKDYNGMDVNSTGKGCNTLTGSYKIIELKSNPDNTIKKLKISFIQHCEDKKSSAVGTISIRGNPIKPVVSTRSSGPW
jgi:hypothetical protein